MRPGVHFVFPYSEHSVVVRNEVNEECAKLHQGTLLPVMVQ